MTVGERVKSVRTALGLSMDKFASRIGITKSGINTIEHNRANPSEIVLKTICREFDIDYFWLTEGIGDMFLDIPDNTIDELIEEYQINPNQKPLIKAYLKSSEETKERLLDFIYGIIKELDNVEQS